MTIEKLKTPLLAGARINPSMAFSRYAPQVTFEAEGGAGTGDGGAGDDAAKAAADKAAADKAAAEKAAADKAAADKAKQGDGKNRTDAEETLLRENMRRKAQNAELSKELDTFKALGLKPEDIQAMLKEKQDKEKADAEARGEFDRVKEMMSTDFSKQIEAVQKVAKEKDTEISTLRSQIDTLTIGASFSNSKFISEQLVLSPAKARTLYGEHFDVVDGNVVAYDKPRGAAERTPLVDASGKSISFEAAIEKLVGLDPDRDTLVKSKLKPGAGSGSDNVRGQTTKSTTELKGVGRIAAGLNAVKKGAKA